VSFVAFLASLWFTCFLSHVFGFLYVSLDGGFEELVLFWLVVFLGIVFRCF
jgi:hypothetical protein